MEKTKTRGKGEKRVIEYLFSITVAPFRHERQQKKELSKLISAIDNLPYVGHVHLFKFVEGINKHNPKYHIPLKGKQPKVFEQPIKEKKGKVKG